MRTTVYDTNRNELRDFLGGGDLAEVQIGGVIELPRDLREELPGHDSAGRDPRPRVRPRATWSLSPDRTGRRRPTLSWVAR